MIAKIVVHADSRETAITRMTHVLDETVIAPLETNLDFQYFLMQHPNYINNAVDIKFLVNNEIID
jgi:acetyl-CoA carboxylase biotin carboxylase subunit